MIVESIAASYRLVRNAEKALDEDEAGITVPQLIALAYIARRTTQVPSGEVAKYMNCTPAVVTGLVDRLERVKLVTRGSSGDDRRRVTLTATPAGRAILTDADRIIRARMCEVAA